MLITFSCEVYENIIMFGEVGKRLLEMMGYGGKLTGMIAVKDIPAVRTRLRNALDGAGAKPTEGVEKGSHDSAEPSVSLQQRAFPLFEMFDAAEKEECDVKWKSS